MKGFKFIETLEVTFEKDTIDSKTGKRVSIYKTAFFNGKAKTITKVDDIEPELNMSRQEILNVIDKWVSEGSGWVIDRIDSHYLNITLYKSLNGSSYIELPTELRNSKKALINMKNKDEECFRWCHIRHLNPQIKYPERIKGARAQIYPLVVSCAFLFTNNFWTCVLGLLLRPACVFHVLQQRKSSCGFPKLVRHGRIGQFQ